MNYINLATFLGAIFLFQAAALAENIEPLATYNGLESSSILNSSEPLPASLMNKTGKSKATAIGISIVPGAGQLYNNDLTWAIVYLVAAVGVLAVDGGLYFSNNSSVDALPIWIGVPAISLISMIHAGVQTEEEYVLQF